jgi:hypothetical protein
MSVLCVWPRVIPFKFSNTTGPFYLLATRSWFGLLDGVGNVWDNSIHKWQIMGDIQKKKKFKFIQNNIFDHVTGHVSELSDGPVS